MVATASLELGIDIGSVDLVCQIGSPRSIAVALQRVGRAGHWVGALPKGRLFATTRDELIECAALVRAIRRGELDRLELPRNSLDILAQQIVAACAVRGLRRRRSVRAGAPRLALSRRWSARHFDTVIEMLSEGIATARGRSGAYLHRDAVNRVVRGRRGARLAAITSGGAIPDTAQYLVVAEPEGVTVGTVDEDFAVESMAGDVFLLGTTPGASAAWSRAACAWKMRTAPRPASRSGSAKRRAARASCRTRFRDAARGNRATTGAVSRRECGLDRLGARTGRRVRAGGRSGAGRACRRDTAWWPSAFSTKAAACNW